MNTNRGLTLLATGCAGVLLLVGCGAKVVSETTVEANVAKQLAAAVNQPTPKVDCPGDLDAKVGATYECKLTAQGDTDTYPVTVKVTSLKDGTARFSAVVGDAPVAK
jgi:hypothetical protein